MIPEREREALMRLTMCAREECIMCEYHKECDFDFQYELATESMNILAEALRKTEPQRDCNNCKRKGYEGCEQPCLGCGWCDDYEPKDEPQTESTGSPIGDYRDGVGAWQTDCPWK